MLFLSSLCEDMPLHLPSTCGWESATVCAWIYVTTGNIVVVMLPVLTTLFQCCYFKVPYIIGDMLYHYSSTGI